MEEQEVMNTYAGCSNGITTLWQKGCLWPNMMHAVGQKSNNFAATNPVWAWKPVVSAVFWDKKDTFCSPTWLTTCCPISITGLWLEPDSRISVPNGSFVIC